MAKSSRDLDSIELIFDLPEKAFGGELKYIEMYQVLVHRIRREIEHLPLVSFQIMNIERAVFNYVDLRYKEATDGFRTPTEQKDVNAAYLALSKEINLMLRNFDIDERATLTKQLLTAAKRSLSSLSLNDEDKFNLIKGLSQELSGVGWNL